MTSLTLYKNIDFDNSIFANTGTITDGIVSVDVKLYDKLITINDSLIISIEFDTETDPITGISYAQTDTYITIDIPTEVFNSINEGTTKWW